MIALMVLAATAASGCTETPPPDPIFIQASSTAGDGDVDSDGDSGPIGPDDSGPSCTGEDYPCGPYGNGHCEVIADHGFVPANDYAEDLAGSDGIFDLSDIYADESIVGILLFGTAGWCSVCGIEEEWLNSIYDDFQDVDGEGGRIEIVAVVFEGSTPGVPATVQYAESYAERGGLRFPAVADTRGDVLYYFDAQSSPGNILIDATEMRIHRVIQGFVQSNITGTLYTLDGNVNCR